MTQRPSPLAQTVVVRALRAAIEDAKLERQGFPIEFYFDADVVVGALFPGVRIQAAFDEAKKPEDRRLTFSAIVRSYWLGGLFGSVAMTWPHAGEYEQLRHAAEFSEENEKKALSSVLQQIHGQDLVSQLRNAISAAGQGADAIAKICESIGSVHFGSIVILDALCAPSHAARLKRVEDLVTVEHDPKRQKTWVAKHPEFHSLCMKLTALRHDPRPESNSVADTAALLLMIDKRSRSNAKVRFYTQTGALQKLLCSDSYLLYNLSDDREARDATFVLDAPWAPIRSSRYIMLRTIFPALRPLTAPGAIPDGTQFNEEIGRLQKLANRIEAIDHVRGQHAGTAFDQFIEEIGLQQDPAGEAQKFVQIAFAKDVWAERLKAIVEAFGQAPAVLSEVVEHLLINRQALLNAMSDRIGESESSLSSIYDASIGYKSIYDATLRARKHKRVLEAENQTLLAEYGMLRWSPVPVAAGLRLETRGSLISNMIQVAGVEESKLFAEVFRRIVLSRNDESHQVAWLSVLTLGAYAFARAALRLRSRSSNEKSVEPRWLLIARLWLQAAEVGRNAGDIDTVCAQLRSLCDERSPHSNDQMADAHVLLEVAWIAFYAVDSLNWARSASPRVHELLTIGRAAAQGACTRSPAGTSTHDLARAVEALMWAERIRAASHEGESWTQDEVPVRLFSEEHRPRGTSLYVEDAWLWLDLILKTGGNLSDDNLLKTAGDEAFREWLTSGVPRVYRADQDPVEPYQYRHLRQVARACSLSRISFGEVRDHWLEI